MPAASPRVLISALSAASTGIDNEFVELGIIPDGDQRQDILVTDFRLGADFFVPGVCLFPRPMNVNNALQRNYVELIGNIMAPRTYVLVLEGRF